MTKPLPPVQNPAPLMTFATLEEFKLEANNFYLMFIRMKEAVGDIYRQSLAFQRFAERYPERATELEHALEAEGRYPGERSWPLLFAAYPLMAELVDLSDPHVVRNPRPSDDPYIDPVNGVDTWYLCR